LKNIRKFRPNRNPAYQYERPKPKTNRPREPLPGEDPRGQYPA
jgi:hypothetical protein